MANNIYPDLSKDRYDQPYARRKILASDLLIRGLAFVNGRLIETGDDLLEEPGENTDGGGSEETSCCGTVMPDDLELDTVDAVLDELGANVDQLCITLNEAYITRFKNYGLRVFRNYVEQQFGLDYVWHYRDGLFQAMIPFYETERFTFQGIPNPLDMYAETTYETQLLGDNINSFLKDNSTIILSTFIGARIRLFRNEVLQSFVLHYTWDSLTGTLTLMIAPQETEAFKVIPY